MHAITEPVPPAKPPRIAARMSLALLALLSLIGATFAAAKDIVATAQNVNEEIRLSVSMYVDASPRDVWAVLVDYDRATRYVSDLETSRIVAREGNVLRVLQKSRFHFGPFTVPVESLKEVRLTEPSRMESRLISGSMKKSDAVTELTPEGTGTRVRYQSSTVPSSPLPVPLSIVRREAEQKFAELRDEILRRKAAAQSQRTAAATQ